MAILLLWDLYDCWCGFYMILNVGIYMILMSVWYHFFGEQHWASPPTPNPVARRQWPGSAHNAPWTTTAGPVHAHRTRMGGHKGSAGQSPWELAGWMPFKVSAYNLLNCNTASGALIKPPHWVKCHLFGWIRPSHACAQLAKWQPGNRVPPCSAGRLRLIYPSWPPAVLAGCSNSSRSGAGERSQ